MPSKHYDSRKKGSRGVVNDAVELALVRKAVELGARFKGYCEWQESSARRLRQQSTCRGMTPEGIKRFLCDHVVAGGEIVQVAEQRPEFSNYRFYYKAIISVAGFPRGLFVEFVLVDDDPSDPAVHIVNAHEQL